MTPGSDVKEHRHRLLTVIINEQNDGRGVIYPDMLPYTLPETTEIFQTAKNNVKYTFLVLQDPSDLIGAEITMDLHRVKDITIRYSFNNNTELIKFLGANDEYPSLYVVDRNFKIEKIVTLASTREAFRAAIRLFLEPKHIKVPESDHDKIFQGKWMEAAVPDMASFMHERERKALKDRVKKMGDVVFQMDLETALR